MITRIIYGRAYKVHSPSLLELRLFNDTDDPDARVFLKYAANHIWELVYVRGTGERFHRRFPSLDQAAYIIAHSEADHAN